MRCIAAGFARLTFKNMELLRIEYFFCILVRSSGFVFTAPFFNIKNVPRRVKVGFTLALSVVLYAVLPYNGLDYNGIFGYSTLIVGELLAGLILGFLSNICYQILAFAGQLIDTEIGLSMVNEFDPVTSAQVTITGNLYSYAVMLMLMVTYMHHYLLSALVDSYQLVPVGGVNIDSGIYSVMVKFMTDYFVIAFRIVLPIFASILIVNTVLAILAKVAPQMNMFVIGIQLKVLVGLAVLTVMIELLPAVGDFIFGKMMEVLRAAIGYLG